MASGTIEGINSGLNTTEIIDAIIKNERKPAVLMEYRQVEKTNVVSAYKALQAKVIALKAQIDKLARTKTYQAASISTTDDTVVNATATGKVGTGSYDLQVLSLARNHQIASQGISDQSEGILGTGTIKIKVGSGSEQTITVDSSNNSLIGLQKAINDSNAGVTANIINDGSSENPYRLVISADKTGVANRITITADLTGGVEPNFDSASFDAPEMLSANSGTTAQVALGSTAEYTGDENKIYTFTVEGNGAYTVGSDIITLHWSDGTNEGDIVVTQGDVENELVGVGADGLKVSLSAGEIHGGDTFQIQSFSPLLQDASDARIAVGSNGGYGSPITITSSTNQFKDVIGGVSLVVRKETEAGESVRITTGVDTDAITAELKTLIDRYNDVMEYIDDQNKYNSDSEEAGVLFGDRTLQIIQNSIQRSLGNRIDGIDSKYNQLYSIGIRTAGTGSLIISDSSRLTDALENNLDDVIKLFTSAGNSSSSFIEFVSSGVDTQIGEDLEVNITQAATHGRFTGGAIVDPSTTPLTLTGSNNTIKFAVDGIHSNDIVLSAKTYNSPDELVTELQNKIDNDDKIGGRGVTVEWVSTGAGTGYLEVSSSSYGSSSKVNIVTSIANSGLAALGLATGISHEGLDVAGTINGEKATGSGQTLTADDDNKTTAGLKLKITLTPDQLVDGAEGTITLSKGIAARLSDQLDSLTATGDGLFDRRIKSYQSQADDLAEQISDFDARLALRREALEKQWQAMEELLGELNSQGSYLTSQLANINANWNFSSNS